MELRQKIERYFNLTEDEKHDVLVSIIDVYRELNQLRHNGAALIKDLIDIDIEIYMEQEEFELVQALTDIRNYINEIEQEIRNGL